MSEEYRAEEEAFRSWVEQYAKLDFGKTSLDFLKEGIEICSSLRKDKGEVLAELFIDDGEVLSDDARWRYTDRDDIPRWNRVARAVKVWLQIDIEDGRYRTQDGGRG
jgi:hypothetical protein